MATGYLTNYAAEAILSGVPMPQTLYLQGHTGDPGADADQSTGAMSSRAEFTVSVTGNSFTNGNTGVSGINPASEDWTHISLWDSSSGGSPWWVVALDSTLSVVMGHEVQMDPDTVVFSLDVWS